MSDRITGLLKEMVMIPGVSGYEGRIRAHIEGLVRPYAEPHIDSIGNLWVTVGDGPVHLMLVAHMDELGFVVTHIEDNGYLRVRRMGGIDRRYLPGRVVEIETAKGTVTGVFGLKPVHLTSDPAEFGKAVSWDEVAVDIGARSRKEAEEMGVQVLDPMVWRKEWAEIGPDYVSARAIDDRFGCAVLIEVLRRLAAEPAPGIKVTLAWSVQEEIGLKGAENMAHSLKPTHVIAVDAYSTADAPGIPFHLAPTRLGGGPVLRVLDNQSIASPMMREFMTGVASRHGLPLQIGATGGGTDGSVFQVHGAQMIPVAVPVRYMHSPVETIHREDLRGLADLLWLAVKELR